LFDKINLLFRPLSPDDFRNRISGRLADDLAVRLVHRERLVVQLLHRTVKKLFTVVIYECKLECLFLGGFSSLV
jgi:hypothetical protein